MRLGRRAYPTISGTVGRTSVGSSAAVHASQADAVSFADLRASGALEPKAHLRGNGAGCGIADTAVPLQPLQIKPIERPCGQRGYGCRGDAPAPNVGRDAVPDLPDPVCEVKVRESAHAQHPSIVTVDQPEHGTTARGAHGRLDSADELLDVGPARERGDHSPLLDPGILANAMKCRARARRRHHQAATLPSSSPPPPDPHHPPATAPPPPLPPYQQRRCPSPSRARFCRACSSLGDVAGRHELDEARHRLALVDGVEDDRPRGGR